MVAADGKRRSGELVGCHGWRLVASRRAGSRPGWAACLPVGAPKQRRSREGGSCGGPGG